jgi:L-fuconate dehydratase
MNQFINSARSIDARFPLKAGAGSDAIHQNSVYSYAVCEIRLDKGLRGTGLAFTIGTGNELVCQAIDFLSQKLIGQDLEELMSNFGVFQKKLADDSQFRWLGPHKGVVHLALAAVTNACFDLWAKFQGKPLWKLLLDLTPQQTVDLLDFSYIEDAFSKQEALDLLSKHLTTRGSRLPILTQNYKAYDTSVGWFNYSDEQVRDEIKKSMALGFNCMKLKVGSKDHSRDIRRAFMARDVAGNDATIMLDCNQQWQLNEAIEVCTQLKDMSPYWIEEPTHPDDILGHKRLAEAIAPIKVAAGEHVPNRIIFKNYLQAGAFSFNQVDAVRVGGISEFILISLMSKKFNIPVVPHVGDMGQIHQHMVLYNHIAMGHDALFLEYIPHLQEHFVHPAVITDGHYITPQEPGASSDLKIQN